MSAATPSDNLKGEDKVIPLTENLKLVFDYAEYDSCEFDMEVVQSVRFNIVLNDKDASAAGKEAKIGFVRLKFIYLENIDPFDEDFNEREYDVRFFDLLDQHSAELGQLAMLFSDEGELRETVYEAGVKGVWDDKDALMLYLHPIPYLEEIVIEEAWRSKGVGSWAVPELFKTDFFRERGSMFMITWPTVLNRLEPEGVNGPWGSPTEDEKDAYKRKCERITVFMRRTGFRRLGTSHYFMYSSDPAHASRKLPIEKDGPFVEVPPPQTLQGLSDWFLAYRT